VKTRTLLLLALGCGVAIMAAGAAFLIQLSRQDDAEPPVAVGAAATVGDMLVVVESAIEDSGVLDVTVTIGGVDDPDGSAGFHLIASGRAVQPDGGTEAGLCGGTTVAEQRCVVRFDVSTAEGDSRVLFYERGDESVRWLLA
jgi:hypothetical protein